jgi:PAS domain S-box-containing protein
METQDGAGRGEAALRESEARLQQILDNTSAVVFAKDSEGRYIFANRELQRMMRLPAGQILGRVDQELWPPDLAERFRRNDLQVLQERRSIRFEETASFGGRERTFLSFKFPLLDPSGTPCAVGGIATDITDRKRIEDALRSAALAVSGAEGASVYQELVRYLATIVDVDIAMIATLNEEGGRRMRMLAVCTDGKITENFDYPLGGTPCETVVGQAFRFYPTGLLDAFPLDADFRRMGVDSYAGYPLNDRQGRPLGLVAVVSRRPMENPEFIEAVLKIFAVRASAELERERAERALRTSEASYREIFESSEDAIFVHDWDTGAIVDVNQKACEIYGYGHDEMRRLTVTDISSGEQPYTAQEAARYIQNARMGRAQRFEWHRRNKDGSLHWDEVVLKRAVIAGEPRILAFTREITERKLTEQALRASEEQYRAIFNASADGLLLRDANFRVVDVNPAFLAITGYSREDVIGVERVLTMPVGRTEYARGLQRKALGGEAQHLEGEGVRKDGTRYYCEVELLPMAYRGQPHVLGILRDVTARRRADEERRRLEEQLRQAQKMEAIGHLTGGIAHDFNNLLTSIKGYVVLAGERQSARDDPRLAKYLEQANLACERARDLIQQMLTFSRGRRGDPRPMSLPPVVSEALKLFRSSLPSTVEIVPELGHEVPAALIDTVQIEQVLLNLCLNARDAMSGVGTIRVSVRHATDVDGVCAGCRQGVAGEFVELRVEDNGPGIPRDVQNRMFEPFFTTKEVGKGSGMGLATVHGIVHEHGGHIVVESHPGEGARFRVLFRPLQGSGGGEVYAQKAETPAAPPRELLQGHVMVVDDEQTVGEFMRDLLDSWGLQVTVFHTAGQARERFAAEPLRYDLVITDQTMPGMTGLELTRALLAVRGDLPVILYTGYSDGISSHQVDAAGVRSLVRKPIEPHELFGLLKTHLPR